MKTLPGITSIISVVVTALLGTASAIGQGTKPAPAAASTSANPVANAGFEASGGNATGLAGWGSFWARKPEGGGAAHFDPQMAHGGQSSLSITTPTAEVGGDWAVTNETVLKVTPGDVMRLAAWSRAQPIDVNGAPMGDVQVSVLARDKSGGVLSWVFAPVSLTTASDNWSQHSRRFVVPEGCATLQVRITGNSRTALWVDDVELIRTGNVGDTLRSLPPLPPEVRAKSTASLDVRLATATGALTVTDRRPGGGVWTQRPLAAGLVVENAAVTPQGLKIGLWDTINDLHLWATIVPSPKAAEVTVTLEGDGALDADSGRVAYPPAWQTAKGETLIVPQNEGILYPVDDPTVRAMELSAYSGSLCMPWYGQTSAKGSDDGAGVMSILGTPNDARIAIERHGTDGKARLSIQPLWEASRGRFSYPRRTTFVFFTRGGYVAQAKRYREWAKATGLFKTLAQKRAENPNIDKLIGAVNIWNWDMDRVGLCTEMKSLSMDHVLWSSGGKPEELAAINRMGYLTGRYDIYQDVWPAGAPGSHEGWPDDLMWDSHGKIWPGWATHVHNKDGTMTVYPGGIICSPRGLARAKQKIPDDLKTHPYEARFLDTTTAAPFRECYNPAHPLSRSDDRKYKMALLEFCSKNEKLVVGTETGIDPSVPYVAYYEGMMSLTPYRLPDAGRDLALYKKPTPEFLRFQVGPVYRVPLWELVYHDCVVSDWYWGDYNNKAPEVWDRRDLFNILYGTPPMFLFDKVVWAKEKEHFVRSYKAICPLVRRLGYDEMLSHRFLNADHTLQQTRWRSGAVVTVNFGETAQTLPGGGAVVAPMSYHVTGSGTGK